MKKIEIFDTTLRDGEQSPGINLNWEEKLEIARALAHLNVHVIEAGFPVSSQAELKAVQEISRRVGNSEYSPVICALARSNAVDLEAAWEGVRDALRPRIHTFISSSSLHMQHQLNMNEKEVLEEVKRSVAFSSEKCETQFSPMDATRSDPDFVVSLCLEALQQGATILNIPDTVGISTPRQIEKLIKFLKKELPLKKFDARLSIHTHDDLGLAVANAYSGCLAGAVQIECAINGIGERAGNASLEEIAILLHMQGIKTGVKHKELARVSRLVSLLTGYAVPPNKAVVGRNAFSHESGIHQDGVLKKRETYEILSAESVGQTTDNQIFLGKHSGRHAFQKELEKLGIYLSGEDLLAAFKRFKKMIESKKTFSSRDLEILAWEKPKQKGELIFLEYQKEKENSSASLKIKVGDKTYAAKGQGLAPLHAAMQGLQKIFEKEFLLEPKLEDYQVQSVSEDSDSLAQVSVLIKHKDKEVRGIGVDEDVIEASVLAYLDGLLQLI